MMGTAALLGGGSCLRGASTKGLVALLHPKDNPMTSRPAHHCGSRQATVRTSAFLLGTLILVGACRDAAGVVASESRHASACEVPCSSSAATVLSDERVTFSYDATRLHALSVGGVNLLTGGGGYVIGSRSGRDDPASNFSSVGSDGRTMTNGGPSYRLSFFPKSETTLGFRVSFGPITPAQADPITRRLARISVPLDFRKDLVDRFGFAGNQYFVNNASRRTTYTSGSSVRYASIPTPFPIYRTAGAIPHLLGYTGVVESRQATVWGEVAGSVASVRIRILSHTNYRSMEFYNHFGTHNIEMRVGPLAVGQSAALDGEIIVTPNQASPPSTGTWAFEAERDLAHQAGRRENDGWSVNVSDPPGRYLSYGPYTSAVTGGRRTATYRLMLDNVTADNNAIVRLDVFDAATGKVLASRNVRRREFNAAFRYQAFDLPFRASTGQRLEFRTYWIGGSYVRQDNVIIR